ncbi:hypothetical protein [Citrobacter portucalensis]|uniref:hypothetical protein n=1 Tax=Citrobacter portucalensis TaxID=1639133 RepID=UPI002934ED5C|nr:hypothetical protein [Citrobacter portucalensis]
MPRGFCEGFTVKNKETGKPVPFVQYRITTGEGNVYEGVSDQYGKTMPIYTAAPTKLKIEQVKKGNS